MKSPDVGQPLSRRAAVGRLGLLLAAGMWPGRLRADEADAAGEFAWVAVNDFHHENAECDPWFEALFRQIGRHEGLAFCAGLGDLANRGLPESLAAIRRASAVAAVPFYGVPGNHDNDVEENTRIYADVFPGRLNYAWNHAGWQFVAIDTTEGNKWKTTLVSADTLAWLDATVPTLDRAKPTVLCTHFPLTPIRNLTPVNAEDVLARLVKVNLRGAFSGHFHGQTAVSRAGVDLVTNVCCARVVKNHDGSLDKGYWLCHARSDGGLRRTFVPFSG